MGIANDFKYKTVIRIIKIETPPSTTDIIFSVSKHTGISIRKLATGLRQQDILNAKFIAIYIMYNYTNLSCNKIADYWNYSDHTAVLNALKRIQDRLDTNDSLIASYYDILNDLKIKEK